MVDDVVGLVFLIGGYCCYLIGYTFADLWWDYYEIEKSCGDQMKACMILQNADRKLKSSLKQALTMRRLKANMN